MLRSVRTFYDFDLQDESRLQYCFRIERLDLCENEKITDEGIKGLIHLITAFLSMNLAESTWSSQIRLSQKVNT
jgi:hypothetical protein